MNNTVVTVGRVSIDLYGIEAGASFGSEQTFSKSVGGSPSNVAVAAAKEKRVVKVAEVRGS